MHIYILIRIQADAAQKERDAINEAKRVVERQRKRKITAAKKKAIKKAKAENDLHHPRQKHLLHEKGPKVLFLTSERWEIGAWQSVFRQTLVKKMHPDNAYVKNMGM